MKIMGEIVDLTRVLRDNQLEKNIDNLNEIISDSVIPSPKTFGWEICDQTEDGHAIAYMHTAYAVMMAYIPSMPEYACVHYKNGSMVISHLYEGYTLEEISLGLEFGTLPDPIYEKESEVDE